MNRRDFLVASSGLAGAGLAGAAAGQSKLCPPLTVGISGGAGAITDCGPVTAEADWIARSTGPGVVWAHDFRAQAEMNQFLVSSNYGNDPTNSHGSTLSWCTTDSITGGACLQITVPTGGIANGGWWRPMSAIRAGDNGKSTDDPAAGGTVPVRAWDPTNTGANYNWRGGYYGNIDYHNQYPTWQGYTNIWDGTEFYLQFRVKQPASRWQPRNPQNPNGKLVFIDVTGETSNGELVIISGDANLAYWYQTSPFDMYTDFGSNPNSALSNPQGYPQGASIQPGSPFASTCTIGGNVSQPNMCWEWPPDEWVTVLIHLIPGHQNPNIYAPISQWPNTDTTLQAWVARAGEKSYTPIFSMNNLAWMYGSNLHPIGAFNSICPSAYMNNVPAVLGWYHRFTQIIFSQQFIPCPQV